MRLRGRDRRLRLLVAFVAVLRGSGEPAAAASAAFLLLGGLLATPVLVAVYLIVRPTSPAWRSGR